MIIRDLALGLIAAPEWNSNEMDDRMRKKLRSSIERFGAVVPLVVRPIEEGRYELIGGAQRLIMLRAMGMKTVSCVIVQVDDTESRLLSQALNRIHGEDNLGLRG